jgi:NADH-quinone oxidoreductase subunit J
MDAVLFLIFAAIAIVCAVNLVLQRHPIASALSLIGVMGSLAALFLQLGAEFLAAAQLVVYAGAIMVLFVFVIMLLNEGKERKAKMKLWVRWAGAPLLLLFAGLMAFVVQTILPTQTNVRFGSFAAGTASEIGVRLFTAYLLPFEVTSVLILIAIVGAIVLARKEID